MDIQFTRLSFTENFRRQMPPKRYNGNICTGVCRMHWISDKHCEMHSAASNLDTVVRRYILGDTISSEKKAFIAGCYQRRIKWAKNKHLAVIQVLEFPWYDKYQCITISFFWRGKKKKKLSAKSWKIWLSPENFQFIT